MQNGGFCIYIISWNKCFAKPHGKRRVIKRPIHFSELLSFSNNILLIFVLCTHGEFKVSLHQLFHSIS